MDLSQDVAPARALPRTKTNDVNDFVVSFALVSMRLIRAFLAEGARRTEARFSGAAPEDVVLVSGGVVCKGRCRRGFTQAGLHAKSALVAVAIAAFGSLVGLGVAATTCARAAEAEPSVDADIHILMLLLLLFFGVLTAVLHLIGRYRWTQRERELADELARTRGELDRANLFLASEPQIVVAWDRPDAEPRIEGEFALVTDAPLPRRVLAFASWLEPNLAAKADEAVAKLLGRGEAFSLSVPGLKGRHSKSSDGRSRATPSCAFATFPATDCSSRGCTRATPRARRSCKVSASSWTRPPIPLGRAAQTGGSNGPTRPMRAPWRPRTATRQSKNVSNCSIVRCGRPPTRRARIPASGAGGRPRSWPASARCSRCSRSRPRREPPASRSIFPRPRRCAPRWSATSAPIRACSINCRRRLRSSTAPNG